jgi:hypothetical protein
MLCLLNLRASNFSFAEDKRGTFRRAKSQSKRPPTRLNLSRRRRAPPARVFPTRQAEGRDGRS